MVLASCAGWQAHHVAGRCLYDHNPSPQRCARMGGVWDDSRSALQRSGGECITEAQAQQRYDAAAGAIEMDVVQLSHDGGLAGFGELGAHSTIRRVCRSALCMAAWRVTLLKPHAESKGVKAFTPDALLTMPGRHTITGMAGCSIIKGSWLGGYPHRLNTHKIREISEDSRIPHVFAGA